MAKTHAERQRDYEAKRSRRLRQLEEQVANLTEALSLRREEEREPEGALELIRAGTALCLRGMEAASPGDWQAAGQAMEDGLEPVRRAQGELREEAARLGLGGDPSWG